MNARPLHFNRIQNELYCTVKPVLSSRSGDRVKWAFEGRWLHNTGQFATKLKTRDHKKMTYKGRWVFNGGDQV